MTVTSSLSMWFGMVCLGDSCLLVPYSSDGTPEAFERSAFSTAWLRSDVLPPVLYASRGPERYGHKILSEIVAVRDLERSLLASQVNDASFRKQ